MIINIDGEEDEMIRVNGVKISHDKINVMDLGEHDVLAGLPWGFKSSVHDAQMEEVFASRWKSIWDPNNITMTPESGEWEVGLSVSAVVNLYINYFVDTYWHSNSGSVSYCGNVVDGDATALEDVRIYVRFSTERALNMFYSGEMDRQLFKKRYDKFVEEYRDELEYTGDIDASLSPSLVAQVDPRVWTIALMCSKALVAKFGEDPKLEDVVSDFITAYKDRLADAIYVLSPSDRAEAEKVRTAMAEANAD